MTTFMRVSKSTSTSLSNNARTKITGLGLEVVDPTGTPAVFNNGTQTFAARDAGDYLSTVRLEWNGNQAGPHMIELIVNGDTTNGRILLAQGDVGWGTSAATNPVQVGVAGSTLDAGDTLELYVRQITGGTAAIAKVLEWTVALVHA